MNHKTMFAAAMAAVLAFAPAVASADASVKARLDARSIKYTVDDDGDYKITYNYSSEGRTQLVFVSGSTQSVGAFRVREVFAPAARISADGITASQLAELLETNRQMKLGAWEVAGDVLYFVIKLPESLDASELESAMDIAAETADDMEIRFSGDEDNL